MFKPIYEYFETANGEKLKKIEELLFPPYEIRTMKDGSKYSIDSSVDSNLDAVLQDIKDGYVDEISMNTLEACIKKILSIRTLLKSYQGIDEAVTRYIIAIDKDKLRPEDIEPSDNDSKL